MLKKILFLTGTRADFGKLKSLIEIVNKCKSFQTQIFVTGMHMEKKYGYTLNEVLNCGYSNIYTFKNSSSEKTMDITLSNTIRGLSEHINKNRVDLLIVHGDRVEALAGAIVGALNNVLVGHIEGGEVSGTIDELIRHSVSKLSHLHFVANDIARKRLLQMGELGENIFKIGSPDMDIMFSNKLPSIEKAKEKYDVFFENYSIIMFHSVTTEFENFHTYACNLVEVILKMKENFIVIYPNNDLGSGDILKAFLKFKKRNNIKIFPSIRFEYFLTFLKHSSKIIGNSSAGIREAPAYGVTTIDIGSRQNSRHKAQSIINCGYEIKEIEQAIKKVGEINFTPKNDFGEGNSDKLFLKTLKNENFWKTSKQKTFNDL